MGNKAESDLLLKREVFEEEVHKWCHTEGGMMPYLETTTTGDPRDARRLVRKIFCAAARAALSAQDQFGIYRPPQTLVADVHSSDDEADEDELDLAGLRGRGRGWGAQRLVDWASSTTATTFKAAAGCGGGGGGAAVWAKLDGWASALVPSSVEIRRLVG